MESVTDVVRHVCTNLAVSHSSFLHAISNSKNAYPMENLIKACFSHVSFVRKHFVFEL